MKFDDAVSLVDVPGIAGKGASTWADLGAGAGVFSTALASLLAPGSMIYAVDKSPGIREQITGNQVRIVPVKNDFVADEMKLPLLDGILMANSFHFVKDKLIMMEKIRKLVRSGGMLILVEYDTDTSNRWVPYPVSFKSLQGFKFINKVDSVYQDAGIYGAYQQIVVD